MRRWALILAVLLLAQTAGAKAADGLAPRSRKHVGRVKAVDPTGSRLVVEGLFHDRSFREISVSLEADASTINPDLTNPRRPVGRRAVRPGYYVILECTESGKRHIARKVTITSTGREEALAGTPARGRHRTPGEGRGMGGGPR